jgi:hypothetical protein
LVDYYADHDVAHQSAVELAIIEFKVRQDIYGEDALAWALYRDEQVQVALSIKCLVASTQNSVLIVPGGMRGTPMDAKRLLKIVALLVTLVIIQRIATAHPMGDFGINHYTKIVIGSKTIRSIT